ncbi:hypothetical protein L596_008777 [Steinernema carpocapsae]|uniref:Serpin domain-containing protein n=1 Tax=Steinernema carpocapsae TaxID=34508 RepID=A0A4U5PDJ8_STECR|nr:hypothetical protein L596_008777 [Steinernema carpocapsae]
MPPENQTLSELAEKFINKRLGFTEMSFWNDAVSRRNVFGCCLNITLPKFKAKSTFKLRTVLEKLGVETLFKNADFSGITNSPIQISDILHKAKIDVNEEGFSAPIPKVPREQWWGDCKNCKTERSIVANRPFFYGVLHNSIPKFIGQYY